MNILRLATSLLIPAIVLVSPQLTGCTQDCAPPKSPEQAKRILVNAYENRKPKWYSFESASISSDVNIEDRVEILEISGPRMSFESEDVRYIEYLINLCGEVTKMTVMFRCGNPISARRPPPCEDKTKPWS